MQKQHHKKHKKCGFAKAEPHLKETTFFKQINKYLPLQNPNLQL